MHRHTKRFAALLSALFAIAAVGPLTAFAANHKHKHAQHSVIKKGAAETEPAGGESSESASESSPSDGPGGHEDPAGAETDHQFEGVE